MLKEFFEAVCQRAEQALRPRVIETPEPNHRYAIMNNRGEIEWRTVEPSRRQHKTNRIEVIAAIAHEASAVSPHCVIWCSREGVTLIFDDSNRRDTVTMPLRLHPQLGTLVELEKTKPLLDQKQLIRLLRFQLHGCVVPTLMDGMRRVRFKKTEEGTSVVLQSKASLGRTIENELSFSSGLPETTLVSLPVFDHYSSGRYEIECALETDLATEKFQFVPLAGQIEAAIRRAEDDLAIALVESVGELVPVYNGVP